MILVLNKDLDCLRQVLVPVRRAHKRYELPFGIYYGDMATVLNKIVILGNACIIGKLGVSGVLVVPNWLSVSNK